MCNFCKNNNRPENIYASHKLKDKSGRVLCQYLRSYTCPICCATGDKAHTVKYCPQREIQKYGENHSKK